MTGTGTLDQLVRAAVADRADALALADPPNRATFFSGDPVRLTWAETDAAVDAVGGALQAVGVGVGTPVAIQLPNTVELVITILACARIGAVGVPFPVQHRSHELRLGIDTADVRAMVTAARPDRPDQLEAVRAVLGELGGLPMALFGSETIDGAAALSLDTPAAVEPHDGDPDDVITVCWTSGTTGVPKGVPRTSSMWLASSRFQVDTLGLTADDRLLCPFPVVNMAGIGGMLVPWAMTGAALVLHQPLDLPVFLGQIATEQITYTVAPPPLLNMLLRNEALLADVDLSHIRTISSGSAPLDPWMVEGWQDRGIEVVNVFGSNEGAAMLATRSQVPDPRQRARFFPRPDRPGIDVRLVDVESDEEITTPGRLGELRFRGETVFDGYLGSSGEEFDELGYLRTGDLFEWVGDDDPPRLLRFVDRAKDIVIRGGMNISAAEVETLVASHESVVECAVVGYPDPDLGERVGVFIVADGDDPPTVEIIADHLRSLDVASYKLPERVEIVETLPRNPVGKILKPDLRERWRCAATELDRLRAGTFHPVALVRRPDRRTTGTPALVLAFALAFAFAGVACSTTSRGVSTPGADPEVSPTSTPTTETDANEAPTEAAPEEPDRPGSAAADPVPDAEVRFRTDLQTTGNRIVAGRGVLTSAAPMAVALPEPAVWVVPFERRADGISWLVTLESGGSAIVDPTGAIIDPSPPAQLDGAPPEIVVGDADPTIVSAFAQQVEFETPLPDTRVVSGDGLVVALVEPTGRYGHGVLGDATEAAAIDVIDAVAAATVRIEIAEPTVVEGTSPLLADIDADGRLDILVTLSNDSVGAWLAAYRRDGTLIAESEPIGTGRRWRNQLAVAPLGPDGEVEIVDVATPHIGGIVEYFRLVGDELVRVATATGFTSHVIGTRNLDMGIVADGDGDGRLDVVVPTQDRRTLAVLTRTDSGVEASALIEIGGTIVTNVAAIETVDGEASFAVGTDDSRLIVWPAP